MEWIGHTKFGFHYTILNHNTLEFKNDLEINHWLEQWILNYKKFLNLYSSKDNFYFISYESLCNSKKNWNNILRLLNIKDTFDFDFIHSKKEIHFKIDNKLISKCNMIYKSLLEKSLK